MDAALRQLAGKIKVLLLDVDGVLTDGRIIYDSKGRDTKLFYVHDGMGVQLLKKAGIPTLLVTAKGSSAIRPRARDMQVDAVYENIMPKSAVLPRVQKTYGVTAAEVCYVGDDLVDIGIMKKVGFAVAVFNAVPEVKQCAAYITLKPGGHGAVREVAEVILKAQDKFREVIRSYES